MMNYSIDYANPSYRERTAIHEAGHGLVATLASVHPRVERVALNPTLEGGGSCQIEDTRAALSNPDINPADLLTQAIAIASAGLLAEEMAFGSLANPLAPGDKVRDEGKMLELAEMLRAHFAQTGQRDSAGRARERFNGALALAEFHLRTQWGAVERIAEALLQCGSIPGELVRTLIDTAAEKTKPCATIEGDMRLMSRAGAADPKLGAALRRALDAE
jgi:hypothetical protein